MNTPLITIGIPVYNSERTVIRALKSALMQTYKNIEIIVVDDGSTDNTWELLSSFTDNRLRHIKFSQNKGAAVARNAIIEEAHGEYITFFDADDISHLNRVDEQHRSLNAYENMISNSLVISLCSFNRIEVNGKRTLIQSPGYESQLFGYAYALNEIGLIASTSIGDSLVKKLFKINDPFFFKGTSVLLSPKRVFETIGYYDIFFRRCQDTDWNIRFGLAGGKCIGTDKALVDYYVTPASYKNRSICNYYHHHLFEKHKSSFSELTFFKQITESFLFNQIFLARDLRALSMLLTNPFNLVPLIRFLKSSLTLTSIMKMMKETIK